MTGRNVSGSCSRRSGGRTCRTLAQAGVSSEDANVYAEGVRRGGTMVTARVPDSERARCEAILNRSSVNIRDREAAYRRSGWSHFDTNASPYTNDQAQRERETYRDRGAA